MKAFVFLSALWLLYACDHRPSNFEGGDPQAHAVEEEYQASSASTLTKAVVASKSNNAETRKLIRTGRLTLEVEDVANIRSEIETLCRQFEAYISSETQSHYSERLECTQVARIPSQHFDAFVKRVESLGVRIRDKNIETSDVTAEFVDTEARIKTKRELEVRYRQILAQAKLVSDILSIEAQLNHVRADIEAMEGRIKFLQNQVSYSTLTLSYFEANSTDSAFMSQTIAALSNGWNMLLAFLVAVLNIWPFVILTTVGFYVAVKRSRTRPLRGSGDVVK